MNGRRILIAVGCIALAVVSYWLFERQERANAKLKSAEGQKSVRLPRVEVVHPKQGGLERKTTQPASVHSFGIANLYAQVSGFLKIQNVDIGDRVEAEQLLARIDVPELVSDLKSKQAELELAKSKVVQAEAQTITATADWKGALATEQQAQADVAKFVATRDYREKAYKRIKALFEMNSIEEKLVDESLEQWNAARAAERASQAAVTTAQANIEAAKARIEQAKADVAEAISKVTVAAVAIEKTEVLLNFSKIVAPFKGMISVRNYYPGDFVRAAGQGGESKPVLIVARTDLMRIVVQIPDDDVPFTQPGKEVVVKVDSLQGREFKGMVARTAGMEEGKTRTMRAEIDLPNPDDLLRDGMYGSATISLVKGSDKAITIPSASLTGKVEDHHASVYVVRTGKLFSQKVKIGADDGIHVEVLEGLRLDDWVVTSHTGAVGDNKPVDMIEKK